MDENPRISDLRKKIEKDPGSRLFAQLAEELRKEGRLEEAIQVAYEGLAKHPAYPSARLTLARALLDSGRASEARPELEQIVKAAPDNILAGRLLGEALDALGDLPAALKQLERTLMFSPGDKTMVAHVADLKARLQAPPPVAAASAAPPAAMASAFDAAPPAPIAVPAAAPSLFASEAPSPSIFADESAPAPSLFGDEPAAAPSVFGDETSAPGPSLFADEAATARVPAWTEPPPEVPATLEMPAVSGATIPASIEAPAEAEADAATLPFALADAPPDFSESSASLSAFQFEEPAPSVPEPVAQAAPAPRPAPVVAPAPVPAPVPPPPVAAFSLALDRDLASGTISPGAFNMAELQKHFEAIAAAERAAASGNAAPPAPPSPIVDTAASAPTLPFQPAPAPPAVPVPPLGAAPEEAFTFNSGEFESPSMDTADTMSITPSEGGFALPAVPEPEAFPFDESPAAIDAPAPALAAPAPSRVSPDPDLASQTLPLTSLTLADLYLQQGLKAEAAAVLSQVVREEPANQQARSKLADVSAAVAQTLSEPAEHFAEEGAGPESPVAAPSRPRTRSEIREATLAGLRAFQGAIEREALEQKATEIRAL